MCGRYYVDDETAREISKLVRKISDEMNTRGPRDIHPSEEATVLADQNHQLTAKSMYWGFPQRQNKGLLINARAETVAERQLFRDSVYHRRCIIPTKHYYEWDADKNKVTFFREDSPVLYMAGFYNLFQGKDCFIIITTAANESVRCVHDRMPLLLNENELEDWIYDETFWRYALRNVPVQLQRFQQYEQQSLF